jgi:hypothetical protein
VSRLLSLMFGFGITVEQVAAAARKQLQRAR